MAKAEFINIPCPQCGQTWLASRQSLAAAEVVVYRGIEQVQRRVPCPNCGKSVVVTVEKAWLDDE